MIIYLLLIYILSYNSLIKPNTFEDMPLSTFIKFTNEPYTKILIKCHGRKNKSNDIINLNIGEL